MDDQLDRLLAPIRAIRPWAPVARVTDVAGATIKVRGVSEVASLGDQMTLIRTGLRGEIVRLDDKVADLLPEGPATGIALGDVARLDPPRPFAPHDGWIGRVVDPDGRPLDGAPLLPGTHARAVEAPPPPAHARRHMGERLSTGMCVFNTLLPLARGQRMGLFAGSGVGKSTLLATLASRVDADVIVIGLVGERGRELRHFVDKVLGPEGMKRSVVVAATSDRAPQVRRRCAAAATAVAEHFRDEGRQVLLLVDSVTRFAEAHREVATAAGEPATLRGFPPSTAGAIAALCERAGPGVGGAGDITAIYSVLVAGSDMEEPVADMLRGVLDGHVVLDREIAERGRFPAVDLVRSVSRSLPDCASPSENGLIQQARQHLGTHARAELMIRSGLYAKGSDPAVDAAIACYGALDGFLARTEPHGIENSFEMLRRILATAKTGGERQ